MRCIREWNEAIATNQVARIAEYITHDPVRDASPVLQGGVSPGPAVKWVVHGPHVQPGVAGLGLGGTDGGDLGVGERDLGNCDVVGGGVVPRSLPLEEVLRTLQAQRTQLAVVIDEYRGQRPDRSPVAGGRL